MTDSAHLDPDRASTAPARAWERDDVEVIGSQGLRLAAVHHHRGEAAEAPAQASADDQPRPIVVAVHGYPDHQGVWDAIIPHLLPQADVLTYDVRGVGRSQAPASRAGYRLEHLRADLDAVVAAASARKADVHLLAHDWGSIQAWQGVTGAGPASHVASFTSISGPCLDHVLRWYARSVTAEGDLGERWRRTAPVARQLVSSLYIPFFRVPPLAEGAIRSGVLPRFMAWAGEDVEALTGGAYARSTRELVGVLEWYRANIAARHDATESADGPRRTDVPTLVVIPSRDPYVRAAMATCGEPFTTHFTTRSLDAGHWVVLSRPQQVAAVVLEQMGAQPTQVTGSSGL